MLATILSVGGQRREGDTVSRFMGQMLQNSEDGRYVSLLL